MTLSTRAFQTLSSAALLVVVSTPSLFAQATLLRHCDPNSEQVQTVSTTGFCVNTNAPDASFLQLGDGLRAVLYPVPDCAGPVSVGVAASVNFCENTFSDARSMNDSVRSLFISKGPSPTTLSGVYRSGVNRELEIQVSEDGRISGFLTANWPTTNTRVRVPIHSGVARWAMIGVGSPEINEDAIQPTEDFFLSFSVCGGLFTRHFLDNTTCVSYTGAAEIQARGEAPEMITFQRATVRGNDQRGFDVSSELEAFTRSN